jgi:plastocyanin
MSSRLLKGLIGPAFAMAVVAAACGGGKEEAPSTGGTGSGTPAGGAASAVDPNTAGNISGTIKLDGAAPKAEPIRMNADPVCVREGKGTQTEFFVTGNDGALQNVFVYVKDGLGNRTFQAPTQGVVLDQKGCHYRPHVFGIQVGQPLEVLNSDPTLHNIHALPKANQEFNTGQPIQGMKYNHTFSAKEVMVPFKCDVHGWMNAYVGVLDHPYYAVSGEDGKFELKGLPPGTYTIEAWHEKLGPMTQSVTIAEKETKEANFNFKMTS